MATSTSLLNAFNPSHVALVALGSALGGVLRWGVGVGLQQHSQPWPWATLVVNGLGGLLMGGLLAWFAHSGYGTSHNLRLFCAVGVLGGFTTFSAFSAESLGLLLAGHVWQAFAHACLHVLGALALAAVGYAGVTQALTLSRAF